MMFVVAHEVGDDFVFKAGFVLYLLVSLTKCVMGLCFRLVSFALVFSFIYC